MTQALEAIQESILEALHRGEPVDREHWLAQHPEHAAALQAFFRVLDVIEPNPASVDSAPLTRLGEFEIVRELGRGGMGIVYEAVQLSLRRRVALKILPPALGGSSSYAQRFRREAEAAARLRHPGIVPVYACGEVAGTPFIALELVEGRSLAQCIAQWRTGNFEGVPSDLAARRLWTVELGAKVAQALAYAHGQGIVHRDVKPGNILLERDGTPRLTDFGLAADEGSESLTRSGEVFGSPRYMSPEQAFRRLQPIDGRSDVYSLGVTLYELLLLRFPYRGETSSEYLSEVSQGRVVPPREVDPSIPPALETALMRALAHDPAQRYATAADFARDLTDLARRWSSLESAAPPAPRVAQTRSADVPPALGLAPGAVPLAPAKRSKVGWWVALGCALLLVPLLLIVGIALFLPARGEREVRKYIAAEMEREQALLAVARQAEAQARANRTAALAQTPRALTAKDLGWLADGQHPQGTRWLQEALRCDFQMRSILARDQALEYTLGIALNLAEDVPPDVEVSYLLSVAKEGELVHCSIGPVVIPIIAVRTCEARIVLNSRETLPLLPREGGVELALVHSVEVRVARPGRTAGSAVRQSMGVQRVQLLPSYPPDYPRRAQLEGLDETMSAALRPVDVHLSGALDVPFATELRLSVDLPFALRPAPVAGRVLVKLAEDEQAFAMGAFQLDPLTLDAVQGSSIRKATTLHSTLAWSALTQEEQTRLMAKLRSPEPVRAKIRFESDRAIALRHTQYEEMWFGQAEHEVELRWQP